VAASSTRNEVYVVNGGGPGAQGSISVINAENNSVAATIALDRQPVSIDLDPGGDLAYVANSGSNTISVVDLKARREIAVVGTGEEPVEARVSPDGKTLVVPNRTGNSVSIVDAVGRVVRAVFEDCPGASDAVILPDSSKAFVACSGGHQLLAIALAHSQAHPNQPDRLEAVMDVGTAPLHLALKPDGGELFVSNALSDNISEVVTSTDDVGGAYMIGNNPVRGLVSRDNSILYISALHSQEVGIYAIDDGKLAGEVHVGDGPAALAFSAAGICCLWWIRDRRMWPWCGPPRGRCLRCCPRARAERDCGEGVQAAVSARQLCKNIFVIVRFAGIHWRGQPEDCGARSPANRADCRGGAYVPRRASSHRRVLVLSGLIAVASIEAFSANPASQPSKTSGPQNAQIVETYGKLPLSFEVNTGQADRRVKFLARGGGYGCI